MPDPLSVHASSPTLARCPDCDTLAVSCEGELREGERVVARYRWRYVNGADHPVAEMLLQDAEATWGLACEQWLDGDNFALRFVDPEGVAVSREGFEALLSAAEVRSHPQRETALAWSDAIRSQEGRLRSFFERCACGERELPLEHNHRMPDDIFALGDERERRAKLGRSFCVLDGQRFFVRGLLPVEVEGYGDWSIGVWVELPGAQWQVLHDSWDEPSEYLAFRAPARLANALGPLFGDGWGLSIDPNAPVELYVPDADQAPRLRPVTDSPLAQALSRPWSRDSFERFAVERGYL